MESITRVIKDKMNDTISLCLDIIKDVDTITGLAGDKNMTEIVNEFRKTAAFMRKEYSIFIESLSKLHHLMTDYVQERRKGASNGA